VSTSTVSPWSSEPGAGSVDLMSRFDLPKAESPVSTTLKRMSRGGGGGGGVRGLLTFHRWRSACVVGKHPRYPISFHHWIGAGAKGEDVGGGHGAVDPLMERGVRGGPVLIAPC
jgi:hypothetical protein